MCPNTEFHKMWIAKEKQISSNYNYTVKYLYKRSVDMYLYVL